jgi:hypothetical protein
MSSSSLSVLDLFLDVLVLLWPPLESLCCILRGLGNVDFYFKKFKWTHQSRVLKYLLI